MLAAYKWPAAKTINGMPRAYSSEYNWWRGRPMVHATLAMIDDCKYKCVKYAFENWSIKDSF